MSNLARSDAPDDSSVFSELLFAIVVAVLYLGSPLWDAVSLLVSESGQDGRVSLLFRGVAIILCGVYLLVFASHQKKVPFVLLAFSWAAGWFSFLYLVGYLDWISGPEMAEHLVFLIKVFSIFFYLAFLAAAVKSQKDFILIARSIDFALLAYVAAILVSPLLGLDFLHSYSTSERFGYRGIIAAPNEAAAVLIAATGWFCVRSRSHLGGRNWFKLAISLTWIASALLGTKAAVIGSTGILVFYAIERYGLRKACAWTLVLVSAVGLLLWYYYTVGSFVTNAIDATVAYYKWQWVNTAQENVVSLLISGRDTKAHEVFAASGSLLPWSIVSGGYPVSLFSFEMDFLDLLYSVGVVGTVVYTLTLISLPVVTRGRYTVLDIGIVFVVVVIAFIAGHILSSGVGAVYLAAVFFHMRWHSLDARSCRSKVETT